MQGNYWEIIDNNGVIHSGSEDDMKLAFNCMHMTYEEISGAYDMNSSQAELHILQYKTEWEGDLKLVEVHQIHK